MDTQSKRKRKRLHDKENVANGKLGILSLRKEQMGRKRQWQQQDEVDEQDCLGGD